MNVFFHRSSFWANTIAKFSFVVFWVGTLILSGCNQPELGTAHDITEDLHHRLSAGMFEPIKDPFFIRISSGKKDQPVVGSYVYFSWERGNFQVKVDEGSAVVMYMDTEAIFSHINFFADKRYSVHTLYSEYRRRPVVTTGFSSD